MSMQVSMFSVSLNSDIFLCKTWAILSSKETNQGSSSTENKSVTLQSSPDKKQRGNGHTGMLSAQYSDKQ